MLLLNEAHVHRLLPMRDCIGVMERLFASLAMHPFAQPARVVAWESDGRGAIAAMPAWLSDPPALGAKLIAVFPQNRQAGLESHQGIVALHDPANGTPLALLHAGAITAIRTAAVSAVATKLLANRGEQDLALLGSGVQARMHAAAMLEVRPIRRVRVWSRRTDHARACAALMGERYGLEAQCVGSAHDAVRGAGIVCTVTAATEPVLKGAWLHGGMHVNAVGASVPPFRELDADAVARSRLFADDRVNVLREADDVRVPIAQGVISENDLLADLAALASGAHPGRTSRDEITIFKSVGMAIEDLAAAAFLYERALAAGAGTAVEF